MLKLPWSVAAIKWRGYAHIERSGEDSCIEGESSLDFHMSSDFFCLGFYFILELMSYCVSQASILPVYASVVLGLQIMSHYT